MARIEDLFWDHIPDDGEWHKLEVNVKLDELGIHIDQTTAGIIVDGKRVD